MNVVIFGLLNMVRSKKTVVTDQRVKLMNELLNGIRVIKYYAWEAAFAERVTTIRIKELLYLKYLAYIIAFGFTVLLMAVPIFLPVLMDPYVDATVNEDSDVIVAMERANMSWVRQEPAKQEPAAIGLAAASLESNAPSKVFVDSKPAEEEGGIAPEAAADIENAIEPVNRSVHTLIDIDFTVNKGELVAVVGPVGCGKSSLLN
eukprot:gene34748-40814_t